MYIYPEHLKARAVMWLWQLRDLTVIGVKPGGKLTGENKQEKTKQEEGKSMTGIIVTGHGTFPEGILSAVSLVAGKPDNTEAVNFEMGQSSEDLKDSMAKAMESLEGDEILILADLVGGTPFNTAAALRKARTDKRIKVIAGVNMAAMVEAVFSRPMYGLDELAVALLAAGREGLRDLDALDSEEEAPEFEDGL